MMAYQSLASHYDDLATGPKQYADYAPEGFYPLDYQEAPGASLYTRLTPAPAISQDDFDRLVIRGPVPWFIHGAGHSDIHPSEWICTHGCQLRLSAGWYAGSVCDKNHSRPADSRAKRELQCPAHSHQPRHLDANHSQRLVVHTFVQFRFSQWQSPAVGSSSNPRLRFAFVDYGYFRVGQDTTVFMDASVFPRTADFQGPNGIVNSRQGLGRITLPVSEMSSSRQHSNNRSRISRRMDWAPTFRISRISRHICDINAISGICRRLPS